MIGADGRPPRRRSPWWRCGTRRCSGKRCSGSITLTTGAYQQEVARQRERGLIEVPGPSSKPCGAGGRAHHYATELPREGEGYDARMALRAAAVAEQWERPSRSGGGPGNRSVRRGGGHGSRLMALARCGGRRAAGRTPRLARTSAIVRRWRRSRRVSQRRRTGRSRPRLTNERPRASCASGSIWPTGRGSGLPGRNRPEIKGTIDGVVKRRMRLCLGLCSGSRNQTQTVGLNLQQLLVRLACYPRSSGPARSPRLRCRECGDRSRTFSSSLSTRCATRVYFPRA